MIIIFLGLGNFSTNMVFVVWNKLCLAFMLYPWNYYSTLNSNWKYILLGWGIDGQFEPL